MLEDDSGLLVPNQLVGNDQPIEGVIHRGQLTLARLGSSNFETCMGRLVSRLESIPISLFDLTATISSSRPKKRLALDRLRAQRPTCWIARFNVANYDDTEGSSPSGASIAPANLYSVDP